MTTFISSRNQEFTIRIDVLLVGRSELIRGCTFLARFSSSLLNCSKPFHKFKDFLSFVLCPSSRYNSFEVSALIPPVTLILL
jgi:hypothetical protein